MMLKVNYLETWAALYFWLHSDNALLSILRSTCTSSREKIHIALQA